MRHVHLHLRYGGTHPGDNTVIITRKEGSPYVEWSSLFVEPHVGALGIEMQR